MLTSAAGAEAVGTDKKSLADLSIEQLMNESVTSVSKKETKLNQSPTAISVVTQDDVRRLGVTSIPEALRLVPGMDVARINASQWAISSRGFNLQYANKLLVLMDGRSVYTPAFGGVYWEAQDMVLEDLDRIEVIRGPGATLWGANALNGVINVTSKNSKDTQGALVSTSFGTEDQPAVSLRYGGQIATNSHYRAYVKYFNRDGLVDSTGHDAPDDLHSIRGGFRADWEPSSANLLTLQGDYYSLRAGEAVTGPRLTPPFSQTNNVTNPSRGGNILGRWTRTFSEDSQLALHGYFDTFRHEGALTTESRDTADLQLEHRLRLGGWNDILWGAGYRFTTDEMSSSPVLTWFPAKRDLQLFTAFLQDELTVLPDRLRVTLGSKFEHNDYTGFEVQPSARLLWTPSDRQTVWAAVSRAVGTPSRFYRGARLDLAASRPPGSPVIEAAVLGNSQVVSEGLYAYELGYRLEPARDLSFDLATFYNVYDHVVGSVAGTPRPEASPPPPHLLLPLDLQNNRSGETYGVELSAQWKPLDYWRLSASYSWLHLHLHPASALSKGNPSQQVSLRSYLSLPGNLELNNAVSFVDKIHPENATGSTVLVPAYLRFDAGVVWHPTASLEIGIWGQNLLQDRHLEFTSQTTTFLTEVPRSVLGKITWRF